MGHKQSGKDTKAIKLVAQEFASAVEQSYDLVKEGSGPADCDLSGGILKRRQAAVLSYMDVVRDRYQEKYPAMDIDAEWARLCSTPLISVNRLDEENKFSLAASIWFLDALCENCSEADLERYLPANGTKCLLDIDFLEPCHDADTIQKALQLILSRDGTPKQRRRLISNAAACRQGPVEWRLPEGGKETLTNRDRFNALMAMLPPEWIQRVTKNFEDKMWEYIDRYFACAAEYDRRERRVQDSAAQIEKECWQLCRKNGRNCPELFQSCESGADLMAQIPSPDQPGLLSASRALNDGRVDSLVKTWREKLAELDELEADHRELREHSCFLPVLECEYLQYWIDHYPPEIRQSMEGLTVNDPYEACFAYLCLVESGSDLPWLNTPALAVLVAAGAKLPWSSIQPGIPEFYDLCFWPEGDEGVHDLTAPEESARKARLYHLQYNPDILPYPMDDDDGPYRSANMPQLAFRLTGLIMPRDVWKSDKAIKTLTNAGIPEAEASVWEQYMRLADEFQARNSRAEIEKMRQEWEKDDTKEQKAMQEMTRRVQKLEGQLHEVREALHDAEKAVKAKQAELEQAKADGENERQELIDLRELVFCQSSGQEPEAAERNAMLPYRAKHRTVVFGGRDNWQKSVQQLLPDVSFVKVGTALNPELIRRAEVVWIQTNYLSHSYYYKLAEVARSGKIPIRYFTCVNANRCAQQLAEADRQLPQT